MVVCCRKRNKSMTHWFVQREEEMESDRDA